MKKIIKSNKTKKNNGQDKDYPEEKGDVVKEKAYNPKENSSPGAAGGGPIKTP
jgi:hypothetical protein